jgi:hypothetical protein
MIVCDVPDMNSQENPYSEIRDTERILRYFFIKSP